MHTPIHTCSAPSLPRSTASARTSDLVVPLSESSAAIVQLRCAERQSGVNATGTVPPSGHTPGCRRGSGRLREMRGGELQ